MLIADDHGLVRDTLAMMLERESDIVVAHAGDFGEAAATLRRDGPFDLVLLDYGMPGMDGLEGLREALALNGGAPVALMSGLAPREVAEEALRMGAAGFLPKTLPARSLLNAVRFMAAGEVYAPAAFMTAPEPEQATGGLTPREREVLGCLCEGLANKEIARRLALHESTVKLHVKTLSRKLGARNRTHAAMLAREGGLL